MAWRVRSIHLPLCSAGNVFLAGSAHTVLNGLAKWTKPALSCAGAVVEFT